MTPFQRQGGPVLVVEFVVKAQVYEMVTTAAFSIHLHFRRNQGRNNIFSLT